MLDINLRHRESDLFGGFFVSFEKKNLLKLFLKAVPVQSLLIEVLFTLQL